MLATVVCRVFEGLLFLDFDFGCCFSGSGQPASDGGCMFCFSLRPACFSPWSVPSGGASGAPQIGLLAVANVPGIRLFIRCGGCTQCWDRFPNMAGGGGARVPEHWGPNSDVRGRMGAAEALGKKQPCCCEVGTCIPKWDCLGDVACRQLAGARLVIGTSGRVVVQELKLGLRWPREKLG